MIRVEVTEADIHEGCPRNMECCPVAKAMARADCLANGHSDEYFGSGRVFLDGVNGNVLYLECGSICIEAPAEVEKFVDVFDDCDREGPLSEECRPFTFELPDFDSGEWKRQCSCGDFFRPEEFCDEGFCPDCSE